MFCYSVPKSALLRVGYITVVLLMLTGCPSTELVEPKHQNTRYGNKSEESVPIDNSKGVSTLKQNMKIEKPVDRVLKFGDLIGKIDQKKAEQDIFALYDLDSKFDKKGTFICAISVEVPPGKVITYIVQLTEEFQRGELRTESGKKVGTYEIRTGYTCQTIGSKSEG